jgi:hypothetical protein
MGRNTDITPYAEIPNSTAWADISYTTPYADIPNSTAWTDISDTTPYAEIS